MKWQTIDTAPKDGTPFLGFVRKLKVPVFVCWWQKTYDDKKYICILGVGESKNPLLFPTHWMPLPEAPE